MEKQGVEKMSLQALRVKINNRKNEALFTLIKYGGIKPAMAWVWWQKHACVWRCFQGFLGPKSVVFLQHS
jgi:hypothetical protein